MGKFSGFFFHACVIKGAGEGGYSEATESGGPMF